MKDIIASISKNWPELIIYSLLIYFLFTRTKIKSFIRSFSLPSRIAIAVVLLLMTIGQTAKKNDTLYPFVAWKMYSNKKPLKLDYVTVYGIEKEGGKRVEFRNTDVFPLGIRELYYRLKILGNTLAEAGESVDPDEAAEIKRQLEGLLEMLGNKYNSHRRNSEIALVQLEAHAVNDDFSTSPTVLLEVGLSSS